MGIAKTNTTEIVGGVMKAYVKCRVFLGVDKFMEYIDSVSTFWAVVIILYAILLFGPICLSIFWR